MVNERENANISIVRRALRIAVVAHEGQTRKGDGSPLIIHPVSVGLKLVEHNFSEKVIAAAFVHDVLEDTDFSAELLRAELGDEVFAIVKAVTNDDSLIWEEKKKKYIETVRTGPEGSKAVSVADKIDNLESLMRAYREQGPDVWKKFNRGREQKIWFEEEVLKMLKDTWEHPLITEYEGLLRRLKSLD